ncbi:efflux RND transporter periplasmic adaptor subunit [Pseudomonas putida]|uniref:efflux RND transporter periplasmic adaptor subunit n=1 Tax=Pseudomonas putida TaxID=303 RepID=UPI000E6B2AB1|nr:efflux RND transporter periplasmic adaptor subunit [Pseudomonas putida]RIZ40601.1 efflux transporter periplasmic adaptor subunit [Pseudomonas putida]
MNLPFKKVPLALAFVLTAAAGTGYQLLSKGNDTLAQASEQAPDAVHAEVDIATPIAEQLNEYQTYSGKLEAVETVDVRPLVPGAITAVHFKDGAQVNRGDLLFTIDTRLYQAAVDQALAEVAGASARYAYAHADAERAKRLLGQNAIAQRDADAALRLQQTSAAEVEAAKARLQTARVNLDYCSVKAPVSGKVSRAELTVGNVVANGASAPVLTRIVSISPIYASFEVDEQTYLRFLAQPHDQAIKVEMGLANEPGFSRRGVVDSVDNQLNSSSGTIRVRARFENPRSQLVPGMYAHVKVSAGQRRQALLINEDAVGTDQDRKFVMVVDQQDQVHYREVRLGGLYDGLRIVESGLSGQDHIIVNGLQRVQADDTVKPHQVAMSSTAKAVSAQR